MFKKSSHFLFLLRPWIRQLTKDMLDPCRTLEISYHWYGLYSILAGHAFRGPRPSHVGTILGAFWGHVGLGWGSDGALDPHGHKDEGTSRQSRQLGRHLVPTWSILGPTWPPTWGSQGDPWRPISSPLGVLIGSWGQDGPKTPKRPSKTDF